MAGTYVGYMRVVLLHALPLTGAMWTDQLAWLPGSTLAPTLYDYGDSISGWAESLLLEAGQDDLVVVGASVGGFCALEMARRAPDQVSAVVLVGSKAGVRRDDPAREHALKVLANDGFEAAWQKFWAPLFGPKTDRRVREQAKVIASSVDANDLARGVRAFFDRDDLRDFARTWNRPVHVISGEHDRTPTSGTSEAVAAEAVQGSFHLIRDCGHYVNLEQPAVFRSVMSGVLVQFAAL